MARSETEKLFEERVKVARLSQIREIVFGSEDGLLVPLGVVSGVAGATTNNFYVLIAGLAEALAGSISMGAGDKWFGVSVRNGKMADMLKERVVEPLRVKQQVIKSSTEVACMILRIDDVVSSKGTREPAGGPPGGGMPPGMGMM